VGYSPDLTPDEKKALLEHRKSWLQSLLDVINNRLDALEKSKSS
jgi:hypothetical protein